MRRGSGKKKRRAFVRTGTFHVYIVECADGTFYTGYSPALAKRIRAHNEGKGAKYTRDRRPVRLVWSKEYRYFKNAFLAEKKIKTMTRIQKKALIAGGTSV